MKRVIVRDAQGRVFGRPADRVREGDVVISDDVSGTYKEQFVDERPDEGIEGLTVEGAAAPVAEAAGTKNTKAAGEQVSAVVSEGSHQN